MTLSILFVLPVRGGSGGANSVVQEAMGLARLGATVRLAVDSHHYGAFSASYPELDRARIRVQSFDDTADLATHLPQYKVVVATTNDSVFTIKDALALPQARAGGEPRVAYYVQDYEPLFYAPRSEAWQRAYDSYTAIPGAMLFAKTNWIRQMVYLNHGVQVRKVEPSIDHDIYYPDLDRRHSATSIIAMLRPATPRRAPRRTARIMNILADKLGDRALLQVFGASASEIAGAGIELSPKVVNRGTLRRTEVPTLLRGSDMFLDLSDFQAFGRTGAESMACGCIPVLPLFGGAPEFARHGRNAYLVDTRSDRVVLDAVEHFFAMDAEARARMQDGALDTAADFTIHKASLSELKLFRELSA